MNKRNNKVWLEGILSVENIDTVELNRITTPVINGYIATESLDTGGLHRFIAYGRLAIETMAFAQVANDDEPLLALLEGWLRSVQHAKQVDIVNCIVVANNISFVVSKEIRDMAKTMISQILQGENNLQDLYTFEFKDYKGTNDVPRTIYS